jgi:hypothetical protein
MMASFRSIRFDEVGTHNTISKPVEFGAGMRNSSPQRTQRDTD